MRLVTNLECVCRLVGFRWMGCDASRWFCFVVVMYFILEVVSMYCCLVRLYHHQCRDISGPHGTIEMFYYYGHHRRHSCTPCGINWYQPRMVTLWCWIGDCRPDGQWWRPTAMCMTNVTCGLSASATRDQHQPLQSLDCGCTLPYLIIIVVICSQPW